MMTLEQQSAVADKYTEMFGKDAAYPVPPFGWMPPDFKWDQFEKMQWCIDRGEPWDHEADYCPWKGVIPESQKLLEQGVIF